MGTYKFIVFKHNFVKANKGNEKKHVEENMKLLRVCIYYEPNFAGGRFVIAGFNCI